MRDTVEAYNRRIKDFEEHNKARQRQLAAFMGHQQQVAAALQQQLDNASSSSTTSSNTSVTSQPPMVTSPTNNNLISSSTTCANSHLGHSSHPEEPVSRLPQCLKITEKVSFDIASEASYFYNLSGQKLIKNAKNGPFLRVFENMKLAVKQCYQTGHF